MFLLTSERTTTAEAMAAVVVDEEECGNAEGGRSDDGLTRANVT